MTAEGHTARGQQGGNQSQPAPFLRKTYDLVDDHTTNHIISWGPQGKSFVVWRPSEFAANLLPQYFKHNNFSSFVRQLNTYGFRKVDPDRWEFANEHFQQHNKELLLTIHRRKPASSNVAIATGGSSASAAPGAVVGSSSGSQAAAQLLSGAQPTALQPHPFQISASNQQLPDISATVHATVPPVAAPSAPVPIPVSNTLHSHGSPGLPAAAAGAATAAFSLSPPFPLDLGIAATLPLFTSPSPSGSAAAATVATGAGNGAFGSAPAGLQTLTLGSSVPPLVSPSPGSAFSRPVPTGQAAVARGAIKTEGSQSVGASLLGPLLPAAAPSSCGNNSCDGPAISRLSLLVDEYLKPGQQMLAAITQQTSLPNQAALGMILNDGAAAAADGGGSDSGGAGQVNGLGNIAGGEVPTPPPPPQQQQQHCSYSHSSTTAPSACSAEQSDPMVADSGDGAGGDCSGDRAATAAAVAPEGQVASGGVSYNGNKRSRCEMEPSAPDAASGVAAVVAVLLKGAPNLNPPQPQPQPQPQRQFAAQAMFETCSAGGGALGSGGGGGSSNTCLTGYDAAGNPLPAGITRPLPQHLGGTTAALLSEMAGQLGRLTALAREVEGLKEENTALKRTMEALTHAYGSVRLHGAPAGGDGAAAGGLASGPGGLAVDDATAGEAGGLVRYMYDNGMVDGGAASGASDGAAGGSSGSGPMHLEGTSVAVANAAVAPPPPPPSPVGGPMAGLMPLTQAVGVQQKRLWDQKLRHDDLEKQLQAQREASAMQAAKTAALEAALVANTAKVVHDAAVLGRVLDERVTAQSEVVRDRLEAQERANKVAQDVNQRLEARVAELESLLKALGQDACTLTDVNAGIGRVSLGAASGQKVPPLPQPPPPRPTHSLPLNNYNQKQNHINHLNCPPPPAWTDAAALDARALSYHGRDAQQQLQTTEPHGIGGAAPPPMEGHDDAVASAAAVVVAPPPPQPPQRLTLALSPEAELYAKSIEDRLWGTVERIVSSASNPADGARLVLQVAKARHDAYAATAATAAAMALSSSSGGAVATAAGTGISSGGGGGGAVAAAAAAAAASDANGHTIGGSGASDSNTPGASGCNAGDGGAPDGAIAGDSGGGGSIRVAAVTAATVSGSPLVLCGRAAPAGHDVCIADIEMFRTGQRAIDLGGGSSGGGGTNTGRYSGGAVAFSERHSRRRETAAAAAATVGEGANSREGSGSCPPPPLPIPLPPTMTTAVGLGGGGVDGSSDYISRSFRLLAAKPCFDNLAAVNQHQHLGCSQLKFHPHAASASVSAAAAGTTIVPGTALDTAVAAANTPVEAGDGEGHSTTPNDEKEKGQRNQQDQENVDDMDLGV